MPVHTTFPGIYIQELPSSTHTITAASTSVAVFVGYTHPLKTKQFNKPIELFGFTDYQRNFGGFFRNEYFDAEAALFGDVAQAVNQFFLNGGADAFVVGILPSALATAQGDLTNFSQLAAGEQAGNYAFSAPYSYPGVTVSIGPLTFFPLELTDSNHRMQITIANATTTSTGDSTADVTITYGPPASSLLAGYGNVAETYRQVSSHPLLANTVGGSPTTAPPGKPNPNYILNRINGVSSLVKVVLSPSGASLQNTPKGSPALFPSSLTGQTFSQSGTPVIFNPTGANDINSVFKQDSALDKVPIFNLLVIPGVTNSDTISSAIAMCERKRAFLIMDPPLADSADGSVPGYSTLIEDTMQGNTPGELIVPSTNSAVYFPYLTTNDPLTGQAVNPFTNQHYEMPPSGTVAGIYANTDLNRGVWKAPAGLATTLLNVNGVVDRGQMSDQRQGVLNPLGINCIRTFPSSGPVVWGARTSISQNLAFQQWMYVPVRRMALFLEQTLYANLGWVVFEPNDQPLWTSIVTSIQSFMLGLFRQGAFQGSTPSQAFQVKCDSTTTTQQDINNGVVNILVAFAPLKPAEFVVIQIAQLAGQAQTT